MSAQELVLVPRDKYNKLVATAAEVTAALNSNNSIKQAAGPTHPVSNTMQHDDYVEQRGDFRSHNAGGSDSAGLFHSGHARLHSSDHTEPSHSHIISTAVPGTTTTTTTTSSSPSLPTRALPQLPGSLSAPLSASTPPHPPPGERARPLKHASGAGSMGAQATTDSMSTASSGAADTSALRTEAGDHTNTDNVDHGIATTAATANGALHQNVLLNSDTRHFNDSNDNNNKKAENSVMKKAKNASNMLGQNPKLGKRQLKRKAKPLKLKIHPDNANLKFMKNWVSY